MFNIPVATSFFMKTKLQTNRLTNKKSIYVCKRFKFTYIFIRFCTKCCLKILKGSDLLGTAIRYIIIQTKVCEPYRNLLYMSVFDKI